MTSPRHAFAPGIHELVTRHKQWIGKRRVALLTHPAAVDQHGAHASERLRRLVGDRLVALLGPEHGFFGHALAGDAVANRRHPDWGIPVYSLYGAHRRPTPEMLSGVDAVVFDLQDLAARPYTYVSTLRYVMEALAGTGCRLVVADRPVPLPNCVDGAVLEDRFASFVASIPAPMHYGMTPGEAARWLQRKLGLDLDLKVAALRAYDRHPYRQPGWPPWIPPSQGIRSWESAWCYTATVFGEALSGLDHGRGTGLPFQVLGAKWMDGREVCRCLRERHLPGVEFHPHLYTAASTRFSGVLMQGVRMTILAPDRFLPITTSVHLLSVLQQLYGPRRVWSATGSRPCFFDALYGTDQVRLALKRGDSVTSVAASWKKDLQRFKSERREALLYQGPRNEFPS